jgi:hypothetical protein
VHEKNSSKRESFTLSLPLYDSQYNGDFCAQKGRYLFFGDVSGHGKKADISAKAFMDYFHATRFSSFAIEQFYKKLHQYLIDNSYRTLVGCVVEICEKQWSIFGVGDIGVLENAKDETKEHRLPHGIIGESYSSLSRIEINRAEKSRLLLMSDGLNVNVAMEILKKFSSSSLELLAISILHFAGAHDDRTITILS